MSDTAVKKCWPWSHNWTKWILREGVFSSSFAKDFDVLVQERHCTVCGFSQIERVRGR